MPTSGPASWQSATPGKLPSTPPRNERCSSASLTCSNGFRDSACGRSPPRAFTANGLECGGFGPGSKPPTAILLKAGQNLVGYRFYIPKPIEECMFSIQGKYNSVWTYDADQGEWLRYVPDCPPSMNNLEFITAGTLHKLNHTSRISAGNILCICGADIFNLSF